MLPAAQPTAPSEIAPPSRTGVKSVELTPATHPTSYWLRGSITFTEPNALLMFHTAEPLALAALIVVLLRGPRRNGIVDA